MRDAIQKGSYDIVITSYDIIRTDISFLSSICFNYCVLDEGHMIKNPNSKVTKCVKQLQAIHRLVMTGTPIQVNCFIENNCQNDVLELWSLFDFLMPGFLGTREEFKRNFGKPILTSRGQHNKDAESGSFRDFLA